MRVDLLLLFCLACLTFTAQAAPDSAKDALRSQKLKQSRSNEGRRQRSNRKHHPHRHEQSSQEHSRHPDLVARRLENRGVSAGGAEQAVSHIAPQDDLVADLRAKILGVEEARREKAKQRLHEMQVEDSIHMAKYGKAPPKFPTITRVGSFIGLSAAVLNVVNFLFSAKTTALATTQFSAPPNPPTLIDTAARWDGSQYSLMPLPEDKPDASQAHKDKRGLTQASSRRLQKRRLIGEPAGDHNGWLRLVRRHKASSSSSYMSDHHEGAEEHPGISKRWMVATGVGAVLGAALAPGFTSSVMNKKNDDIDKPPFDPYDPNILKPKDAFSAAASMPGTALPEAAIPNSLDGKPPDVSGIKFPVEAYSPATTNMQAQPLSYPSSNQAQAVLRKRAVVSEPRHVDAHNDAATSSSELDKRFLFTGGPWSKFAGAVTLGSILPLIYTGVTHARERQYNPRDRDILKDIDDTPTYGAVGVPGRHPGQLATNAMPGYSNYVSQLEQQQVQRQAQTSAALARQQQEQSLPSSQGQLAPSSPGGETAAAAADGASGAGSNDPVLRRRSSERLDKRNKWLFTGGLALFGAVLGYAQSATQFPTDRDEEKDQKKREAKKKQEELAAEQQQQAAVAQIQGASQNGAGAAPPTDPNTVGGGASQADLLAGIPVKPLPGTGSVGGYSQAFGGANGGSGYSPPYAPGGGVSPSGLSSTYGTVGASQGGGTSSLGDSLNAAAGYQSPGAVNSGGGGGGGGGSVLKKRSANGNAALSSADLSLEARSLSKRTPGLGTALSIGGTAMFFGTLAGNIFVAQKQKKKPVPLVTPNANTRGPMIPGGELYTAYLESQRGNTGAGQIGGGVGTGLTSGVAANVNGGAAADAGGAMSSGGLSSGAGGGAGGVVTGGVAGLPPTSNGWTFPSDTSSSSADPVLKKRMLKKRAPLGPFGAVAAETEGVALAEGAISSLTRGAAATEVEAGAASLLGKGASLSESGAARAASAGSGLTGEAAGLTRGGGTFATEAALNRGTWLGMGGRPATFLPKSPAWGSAKPAMMSEMRTASTAATAGTPATIEGATAAAGAGDEPQDASKKGMTWMKGMGILGASAGATMTFNGIG